MNIRKAFALKPYDYETIFASWPDAPIFSGNLKKDLAVDDWLVQIKQGCKARSVPKAIWHNVAQNYLKGKAKRRLEDVKLVMKKMHGGKYKWDWKKFKIAMIHMGCEYPSPSCWKRNQTRILTYSIGELKSSDTQGFKIGSIASGIWWIVGKVSTSEAVENIPASPEPPSVKYPFLLRTVKKKASSIPSARLVTPTPPPPPPKDGGPKRAGGDGVESLLRKVGVNSWHPAEKRTFHFRCSSAQT